VSETIADHPSEVLKSYRYYYAIVTCDTSEAAAHIRGELDGTELERSANVFDISFVPEDMTFDDEPRLVEHSYLCTDSDLFFRDEATEETANENYKALEFVTDVSGIH